MRGASISLTPPPSKMKAIVRFFKPRIIQSVLGLLFVLVAWVVFLPAQVGGNLTYIVITGTSMEPLFHEGDLVFADVQAEYKIGDVVVYLHPDVGRVIHRIIDREGVLYVLKGDNNSWIDGYYPTREEIIGKYRYSIPKVGKFFLKLRQPWLFSLFSGLSVLIIGVSMVNPPQPSKKSKKGNSDFLHLFGVKLSQWKDGYWFPVYIIGLGCLVLGIFAFTKPVQKTVTEEITYTQSGQFAYSGVAVENVYDQNLVQSGDPVFTKLTCAIQLSFDYQVSAAADTTGSGTYQFTTILNSTNGWKRIISQVPQTSFEGNTFQVKQSLDFCEIQEFVSFVGETTGVDGQQYTIDVIPEVNYSGLANGNPFQAVFAPVLSFRVDEQQVYLASLSGFEEENPLSPLETGIIPVEKTVPMTMNILGLNLPVSAGRVISVIGVLLCAIGLIIPGMSYKHVEKLDTKLSDRLTFGQMLIEVDQSPVGVNDRVIEVSSMEDLLLLAEKTANVVMACCLSEGADYFVQVDHKFFHFKKEKQSVMEKNNS